MHVKFFQYLCIQYIYQQKKKKQTHLTQLNYIKIGLSYPLRNTLVVKGKNLREQTKKT